MTESAILHLSQHFLVKLERCKSSKHDAKIGIINSKITARFLHENG